jgi:hypothetical protein
MQGAWPELEFEKKSITVGFIERAKRREGEGSWAKEKVEKV